MQLFIAAFDSVADPRAENVRHDLGEMLMIAFVAVLCGAQGCAGMAEFGRENTGRLVSNATMSFIANWSRTCFARSRGVASGNCLSKAAKPLSVDVLPPTDGRLSTPHSMAATSSSDACSASSTASAPR